VPNEELKIVKTAILNEVEGEKFYRNAARDATDPDTVKAFLHLADDEKRHQQMLKGLLEHIMTGVELSVDDRSLQVLPTAQIFNAANSVNANHIMEISVFHIGILIEKASMDYYRQAAQNTSNEAARKLYESLGSWEMHHLDQLEKIYDSLSGEWWEQQEFSPS